MDGSAAAAAAGAAGAAGGAVSVTSAGALLRFDSLSPAQVGGTFDFLPLVQHTLRQMAHASADASAQTANTAAMQAATSALVTKLTQARDLLQLLPNIDVSQADQEAESRNLDVIIERKKKLIETFRIQQQQQQQLQGAALVKDETAAKSTTADPRT